MRRIFAPSAVMHPIVASISLDSEIPRTTDRPSARDAQIRALCAIDLDGGT